MDFSKAYDFVLRHKLFACLKRLGCGLVMLGSLIAMYSVTESVVGSAVISATIGVRQGLATSCFLFIVYVNELIGKVKEECQPEGFLRWLHILMLMDDTVLLSTSRSGMEKKLNILCKFCEEYGMKINVGKTQFFVINGVPDDVRPICVHGITIDPCNNYIYLGSPFTSNGSTSSAIKEHAKAKLCHVLKFVSFIKKNNDIPFIVKRRVFDAALMSSLLYGCESWIGGDIKPIIKLYNWAMKELLSVRKTTPNIICYAELGYPSLPDFVKYRQHRFFLRMWRERNTMDDDPLIFAMRTATTENTSVGKIVQNMIRTDVPAFSTLVENVHEAINNSDTSRCRVYREINPAYEVHSVYNARRAVNDLHRISFSRFRLSAHNLAIETGRWNRRGRGRLPIEERRCECGLIQTEKHVIEHCAKTQHLREFYGIRSLDELFSLNIDLVCKIVYDVLRVYT